MIKGNVTNEKTHEPEKPTIVEKLDFWDKAIAKTRAKITKQIRDRKLYGITAGISGIILFLNYIKVQGESILSLPTLIEVILWILAVIFLLAILGTDIAKDRSELDRIESTKKRYGDLFLGRKGTDTYFERLVGINIENLGEYYSLVKESSRQSFRLSTYVGVIGFVVLIAGLLPGYFDDKYKSISYLSASAGLIIEIISGVFFWLYNRTVIQLKEYHDSLIDVQNILLSFKLIEDTEDMDKKAMMIQQMIEFLVGQKKVTKAQPKK